ncbi:MAG: integration host factor subunit beta [Myxococcaceae bacterium]|nr:integration host factor subunit beta [Myxococcaceae bacterium]
MTKSQLIDCIAAKAPHIPPRRIEALVNAVFDQMTQALKEGERIELRGFGCFGVKSRPARLGRNPKTGEPVPLPARRALSFAAGKELRERINRACLALDSGSEAPSRRPLMADRSTPVLTSSSITAGEEAPRI